MLSENLDRLSHQYLKPLLFRMKIIFFIIIGIFFAIAIFNVGRKYDQIQKINPTPTPVKIQPTSSPKVSTPPVEIPKSTTTTLTFEEALRLKSPEALENFMGDTVSFSNFESVSKKSLAPQAAAEQLVSYLNKASSWVMSQNDSDILKLKNDYPQAYFESFIILDDQKSGIAFSLNKDNKVLTVIFMSDYPNLLNK